MKTGETERGATINRTGCAAIFLLLGSSFFPGAGAAQSTSKEYALKTDAYDLARRYFNAKTMMEIASIMAPRGIDLITGKGGITKRKVRQYKKKYGKQLSIYAEAINARGYKTIAGSYQARISESCGQIRSALIGSIHESAASGVEIQQDGYEAQLIVRFEYEGEEHTVEHPVIVVETAVLVHDFANEDYYFRGEIKGEDIVIKPDLSVLATWPKWALSLREKDLRKCVITLEPRKGNPGG